MVPLDNKLITAKTSTFNSMQNKDFTTSFLVPQSPEKVFTAITDVKGWWSEEVQGGTNQLNDEFLYHYQDVHIAKIKLVEVVPNRKIVWRVLENYFQFTKDKKVWKDTQIVFDIRPKGNNTELIFTHVGLGPHYECFKVCEEAWTNYINGSLKNLIETGKGEPNAKEGGFNDALIKKWELS